MEGKIGKYQFDSELSLDDLSKTYVSPFPNTQNVENLNTFYIYDENYINLCRIKITNGWGTESIEIELISNYFDRLNDVTEAVRKWIEWTFERTKIIEIKTAPIVIMEREPLFEQTVFTTLNFKINERINEYGAILILKKPQNKEGEEHCK